MYITLYMFVLATRLYERFEDLPVWQEAARLYNLALDLLQAQNVRLGPGWRLQFERAALSVSSNIAEEFERLTPGELRSFLVIAADPRERSGQWWESSSVAQKCDHT